MIRSEVLSATAKAQQARRELYEVTQLATRIASAMSVAGACGHPTIHCWPVAWVDQDCRIYHPPVDGEIDDMYMGNDCLVDVVVVSRTDGIRMLDPYWDAFSHMGAIPDSDEIDAAMALTAALVEMPSYVVDCHHAELDGIAGCDCAPVPGLTYRVGYNAAHDIHQQLRQG